MSYLTPNKQYRRRTRLVILVLTGLCALVLFSQFEYVRENGDVVKGKVLSTGSCYGISIPFKERRDFCIIGIGYAEIIIEPDWDQLQQKRT